MTRAALLACVAASLGACEHGPSDRQLDQWRREAEAANDEAARAAGAGASQNELPWTLTVSGQVKDVAVPAVLSWSELDRMATAHIRTTSPQDPENKGTLRDFRAVLLRDLFARFRPDARVTEVTLVAYDAFRSTIQIADVRRWPIGLAIELDGKPMTRSQGGPIFAVFPHTEVPETVELYPDRYWSFYVTHVVIGTEPVALDIDGVVLGVEALSRLPPVTLRQKVRYKVHWPSDELVLHGVNMADALAAAGASLPPGGSVVARGKAPILRDPAQPIRFSAEDVARCPIAIVTAWGPERQPITARLGGPLAIAVPEACADRLGDRAWVTFLEQLVVERP